MNAKEAADQLLGDKLEADNKKELMPNVHSPHGMAGSTHSLGNECSAQIDKIAEALAKAQGAMKKGASKDSQSQVGQGKFKYADLASVIEAVRMPLSDNGIAFVQTIQSTDDSMRILIVTKLIHSSGQWLRGETPIKLDGLTARDMGKAITYGKRYGLQAITGIPSEDDDGESASEAQTKAQSKSQEKRLKAQDVKEEKPANHEELGVLISKLNGWVLDMKDAKARGKLLDFLTPVGRVYSDKEFDKFQENSIDGLFMALGKPENKVRDKYARVYKYMEEEGLLKGDTK